MTLSYSPAALANSSVWDAPTRPNPTQSPSNSKFSDTHPSIQSGTLSEIQQNTHRSTHSDTHSGTHSGTQPSRSLAVSSFGEDSIFPTPLVEPLPATFPPAARESYIPLVPAPPASDSQFATPIPSDLGLQFDLANPNASKNPALPTPLTSSPLLPASPPPIEPAQATAPPLPTPPQPKPKDFTLGDLFAGGSDSLVAIVVGHAEGTRSPDGQPNKHFYGHVDPGNGVWNLGTFSYQHGAASPEEADMKQLKRLKQQAQVIQEKAAVNGLKLTLEETLNGIDLANQAPKAVIDGEGYVEWLAQAHQMGKSGADAILWARVQSFIDPKTQRWDAPGLGNTADKITHDQQRRMSAIEHAIAAQNYQIASDARLRSQPIGFRLPRWNFAVQMMQKVATLLN